MESVIIKGILEDELERNKRMLKTYMDKYEALRKGSIFVRTKGSGQYCYLNYRDGSRVLLTVGFVRNQSEIFVR